MLGRDMQLIERPDGPLELASPGGSDEHFGNRERAGDERLACEVKPYGGASIPTLVCGIRVTS